MDQNEIIESMRGLTRRHFLRDCSLGLGALALGTQLLPGLMAGEDPSMPSDPLAPKLPHFKPKAKNIIYLHMAGGPSQFELFDYKPELAKIDGQVCPPSLMEGKRFAFINKKAKPKMLGPQAQFKQHGESRMWVSDNLPHFSSVVDDVCLIKSMNSKEFNHGPAQMMLHTGFPRRGRPGIGAWVGYGLGTMNQNLPGYVVLVSGGKLPSGGKGLWGSGFLPSVYQGTQCRSEGDPVLYASNPKGMDREGRRRSLDAINALNKGHLDKEGDPEIYTRMSQYELAFRMQMAAPDAMDISKEPESVREMYGADPHKASLAKNILLARRLVERGVRFVQIFDWGWDTHGTNKQTDLNIGFKDKCKEVDRPMTALIKDLKMRGMLEDTIVVWGGEFGRTPLRENRGGKTMKNLGRDHHGEAFTMWAAGGGFKGGLTYGETDEIGYTVADPSKRVTPHDFQATLLHQLGFNHEKLTYNYQGRPFRLTDAHGHVVDSLLA